MKTKINLVVIVISLILSSQCFPQFKYGENISFGGNMRRISDNTLKLYNVIPSKFSDSSITYFIGETNECDIYLRNRSLLKEVVIRKLVDSVVTIDKKGVTRQLNVQDINKIKFQEPSGFWTGAVIGAGISLGGWTLLGLAFGREEGIRYGFMIGLAGAIPSGLLGGLVGLIAEKKAEVHDLSSGNPKAKLKRLRYLIHEHTPPLH